MKNITDIKRLTESATSFRDERDWKQFNNPKDLAISLTLEAAEVLEHFQWKNDEVLNEYVKNNKEEIGHELSDVLFWVLLMSHDLDIDMVEAFENKMTLNKAKYPAALVKGKSAKYTEY